MVRLMNPGAAMETCAISPLPSNAAASSLASAMGGLRASLGEDQGRVGRGLAVARISRRIDGHTLQLERGRQAAIGLHRRHGFVDQAQELPERVHVRSRLSLNRRSCSSSAKRSVMPAI